MFDAAALAAIDAATSEEARGGEPWMADAQLDALLRDAAPSVAAQLAAGGDGGARALDVVATLRVRGVARGGCAALDAPQRAALARGVARALDDARALGVAPAPDGACADVAGEPGVVVFRAVIDAGVIAPRAPRSRSSSPPTASSRAPRTRAAPRARSRARSRARRATAASRRARRRCSRPRRPSSRRRASSSRTRPRRARARLEPAPDARGGGALVAVRGDFYVRDPTAAQPADAALCRFGGGVADGGAIVGAVVAAASANATTIACVAPPLPRAPASARGGRAVRLPRRARGARRARARGSARSRSRSRSRPNGGADWSEGGALFEYRPAPRVLGASALSGPRAAARS